MHNYKKHIIKKNIFHQYGPLKLLERVFSGACFSTRGVFEYYVWCTRSGVTQCTLFMVRYMCCDCICNTYCWYNICCFGHASVYICLHTVKLCITAGLLFPSQCLWNDLADPVFHGVGLVGLMSRANAFFLASAACSLFFYYCFPFFFFLSIGWYCRAVVVGLIGYKLLSAGLSLLTFFNNNIPLLSPYTKEG